MSSLRAAIVGAGLMGRWHARYAGRVGARVTAVVDPRRDAAEALARGLGGAVAVVELGEALRSVDVVHVCTPAASHVAIAQAALEAGRHVLIEKPATRSATEARRLVTLAERRSLKLSVVHQCPFQNGFRRWRRERETLGELTGLRYTAFTAGGDCLAGASRRGLLLEILPHALSLFRASLGCGIGPAEWSVRRFTGDHLELSATLGRVGLDASVSLRARPTRHEFVSTGTRATARLDLFHGYAVFESGGVSRADKLFGPFRRDVAGITAAATNLLGRAVAREPAYPGLLALIRGFYAAVESGGDAPIGPEEMIETAATLERLTSLGGD